VKGEKIIFKKVEGDKCDCFYAKSQALLVMKHEVK